MNDELYKLWMQRANAEAPADFADRVMDAVRREPLPSSKGVRVLLLSSPPVPRSRLRLGVPRLPVSHGGRYCRLFRPVNSIVMRISLEHP